MRFGPLAVLASVIAHVGLMAWVASVDPPPPAPRPRPTTVAVLDRPPPSTPIDIALVSLPAATGPAPAVPPAAIAPPPSARPRAATAPAISTGATAVPEPGAGVEVGPPGAASGEPTGPTGGGDGTGILDMRRPPAVDLSPRAVAERAHVTGGAPPPPRARPTGELAPSGHGTFRSDQPGFTAKVARNGEVTFEDAAAFSYHFPIVDIAPELPHIIGRKLESYYNDPWADVRAANRDPNHGEGVDVPLPLRPDDADDKAVIVPIVGGTMELTDYVMRKGGIDPYASAKRDFLERTRAERLELRAADEARQLKGALATARAHAARAWARADLDAAARRIALFELWDDAAEDGPPALVAAGDAARLGVLGFIRSHLPAGSPDAFTAAELATLNARRLSKQPFAPY